MLSSEEQMLHKAARDGSIDIAEWPRVLESVLHKLHQIVHNDFPLPSPPPAAPLPAPVSEGIDPDVAVVSTPPAHLAARKDHPSSDEELLDADADADAGVEVKENEAPPNSQSSTKENDAPATDLARAARSADFEVTAQHPQPPPDAIDTQSAALPPDLLSLYNSSTHMLESDFAQSPPYTIQRLAELVLHPKRHYRFLPSYLRALDRIVSVSSPVSDFPLPSLHAPPNPYFLTNGDAQHVNGTGEREGLGSDESLGGALLTPIPWLRHNGFGNNGNTQQSSTSTQGDGEIHSESTETIDGPHGAGSIETVTVTVNGVPSLTSVAHTTPPAAPSSPTLSEQSDASSSSSSGGTTDAQLREQGAVTQGELLRQEQEAGVVPLSQTPPRRSLLAAGAAAVGRDPSASLTGMPGARPAATAAEPAGFENDEPPHARGPEEISVEDMGPQRESGGLDMEAAVGRGRSKSPQPPVEVAAEAEANGNDAGGAEREVEDVEMVEGGGEGGGGRARNCCRFRCGWDGC